VSAGIPPISVEYADVFGKQRFGGFHVDDEVPRLGRPVPKLRLDVKLASCALRLVGDMMEPFPPGIEFSQTSRGSSE